MTTKTNQTNPTNKTQYFYSSRGELLTVLLPDGRRIDYICDPLGRRIAKKINNAVVERYLWQGLTRLLAVFDGSGALLKRFEYADERLPLSMQAGGATYYLTYDQVGSLRLVADASGNVVKRITYDSFGNILEDTTPSFTVPFGFAGGLHDRDSGLVRFGYCDYDPEVGRWTAKDPIGFAGGDTDLYGYVLNNPANLIDPNGQHAGMLIGFIGGAFTGFKAGIQSGGSIGKGIFAGAIGGLSGGLIGFVLPPNISTPLAGAISGAAAGFVGRAAGKALTNPCSTTEERLLEGFKGIPAGLVGGLVAGTTVVGASYLGLGAMMSEATGALVAAPFYWGLDMLFP